MMMMQVDRVAALWFGAMELKLRAPSEVIIIIYGTWASFVPGGLASGEKTLDIFSHVQRSRVCVCVHSARKTKCDRMKFGIVHSLVRETSQMWIGEERNDAKYNENLNVFSASRQKHLRCRTACTIIRSKCMVMRYGHTARTGTHNPLTSVR